MKIQPRRYVSFLLRMWQAEEAGRPVWRAALEDPRTGEVLFFASLARLFQFLKTAGEMREPGSPPPQVEEK